MSSNEQLDGATYGNAWMHRTLIKILKHINIHVLYAFMAVLVIPFTMLFSKGARITYRYFHMIRGLGKMKSLWNTYRNHILFGKTVIDKFAMYAGRNFKVTYFGLDEFKKKTQRPEAMIQLSAHIGCSEIVGYSYDNVKISNVLVYGGEKEGMMSYRKTAFINKHIKMIPVGTDDGHSEEIITALENGEIVYAFADRFMNPRKIIQTKLHGHTINLAKGPFSLAVTRGLDVVMTCAMKESDGSYTAYLTPLAYNKTLKPTEQRQQLAEAYTREMERLLSLYPLQWFNYSDVWVN